MSSRRIGSLLNSLVAGRGAILFEGVHTTGWLGHPRLADKPQVVRVHNREEAYYRQLARTTSSPLRKYYFWREARRLARYEPEVLAQADALLPIASAEADWCRKLTTAPVLHQVAYGYDGQVRSKVGLGDYALFHAGLHVEDNVAMAMSTLRLFGQLPERRLVIAGKTPPQRLVDAVAGISNAELVATPTADRMRQLIADAHVAIVRSRHDAGFKVKVLESLAMGRHVLADSASVAGAPVLAQALRIVENESSWPAAIREVFGESFTEEMRDLRTGLLATYASDSMARELIERLRKLSFNTN